MAIPSRKMPSASSGQALPISKHREHKVTPENFRLDPMYPRLERAVIAILAAHTVVAPVDVLVRMDLLREQDLEAWRFGRIAFLERVIRANLSMLRRLLRILGHLCHELNLKASGTAYVRWGKGARSPLRFTKSGEPKLEAVYARHFVWPGKGPFHLPTTRPTDDEPKP